MQGKRAVGFYVSIPRKGLHSQRTNKGHLECIKEFGTWKIFFDKAS